MLQLQPGRPWLSPHSTLFSSKIHKACIHSSLQCRWSSAEISYCTSLLAFQQTMYNVMKKNVGMCMYTCTCTCIMQYSMKIGMPARLSADVERGVHFPVCSYSCVLLSNCVYVRVCVHNGMLYIRPFALHQQCSISVSIFIVYWYLDYKIIGLVSLFLWLPACINQYACLSINSSRRTPLKCRLVAH